MRLKKCAECGEKYQPVRQMQPCCDKVECKASFAIRHIEAERKRRRMSKERVEKEERKAYQKKRMDHKQPSYWRKRAQAVFNRWVRLVKCKGMPCISCGKHHAGQNHAGHYQNAGDHPELAFEPDNVWLQCKPCNTDKHGNIISYRQNLITIIGIERVEWLEGPHELPHRRKEDYQSIEAHYSQLLKEAI